MRDPCRQAIDIYSFPPATSYMLQVCIDLGVEFRKAL